MISIARHWSGVALPAAERGWEPRGTQAETERDQPNRRSGPDDWGAARLDA